MPWSEEVRVRLGLVRVNSLVIMAIDDNRSLACHGRRPAAHRLINFFECPADIIVGVGLQGEGSSGGLVLCSGEVRVSLVRSSIILVINDSSGGVARRNPGRDFL